MFWNIFWSFQHSKSVGILWGVFTVCSAILNIVVFLQEEWVGETSTSKSPGHFGLWRFCTVLSHSSDSSSSSSSQPAEEVVCMGQLDNFASILSPAFRFELYPVLMLIIHFLFKKPKFVNWIIINIQFIIFRAATVFVGLAVIVGVLSVMSLLLFCFMKSGTVFEVCGVMQLLTGKSFELLPNCIDWACSVDNWFYMTLTHINSLKIDYQCARHLCARQ